MNGSLLDEKTEAVLTETIIPTLNRKINQIVLTAQDKREKLSENKEKLDQTESISSNVDLLTSPKHQVDCFINDKQSNEIETVDTFSAVKTRQDLPFGRKLPARD